MAKKRKMTIDELERMLSRDEDDYEITILPNGEIRSKKRRGTPKGMPLTMGQDLGGEY
jgi:hypothetical protein